MWIVDHLALLMIGGFVGILLVMAWRGPRG